MDATALFELDGTKTCRVCRCTKPLTDFTPYPRGRYGVHGTCKTCRNAKHRRNYHREPGHQRASNLKMLYGITPQQYDELLEAQGGGCAICGKKPDPNKRRLHVDHDHTTGKVRGILCAGCNTGLGKIEPHLSMVLAYLAAGGVHLPHTQQR